LSGAIALFNQAWSLLWRQDQLNVLKRRGWWCWRNVARSLLWPMRRILGTGERPLPLYNWPSNGFFALNRYLGVYGRYRVLGVSRTKAQILHRWVHFITDLLDKDQIVPVEVAVWARTPNHFLMIDLSGESLEAFEVQPGPDRIATVESFFREEGIDPRQTVLLTANAAAAEYDRQWRERHHQPPGLHQLGFNAVFFHFHFLTQSNAWFGRNRGRIRAVAEQTIKTGTLRSRHFMCLNLKDRPNRLAVMLHLLDRGYLEKGWITYHGEAGRKESWKPTGAQTDLIGRLPSAKRLARQIPYLMARVPIALDFRPEEAHQRAWATTIDSSAGYLIPELQLQNGTLTQFLSYFEIVTETYFGGDDVLFITEKLVRPMVRLQPFIHVGTPFALRELRRLGFRTFSPWIDESYDEIVDPVQRMEAVLVQIDRLCAMPLADLHNMYCEMWPILAHNFDRYTDFPTMRELYIDETRKSVMEPLQSLCASSAGDHRASSASGLRQQAPSRADRSYSTPN
jgi:hypothetical protein